MLKATTAGLDAMVVNCSSPPFGSYAANRDATAAAAQEYKESVLQTGRVATGGDLRLSKWGKKGVKLGAGYDVDGQQHG
jgi:hypothetical protein